MIKELNYLFIFVLIISAISACGKSTKKGTDSEVKKIVIEIVKDYERDEIAPRIYTEVTKIPIVIYGVKVACEELVKNINEGKNREVVRRIDQAIEKIFLLKALV